MLCWNGQKDQNSRRQNTQTWFGSVGSLLFRFRFAHVKCVETSFAHKKYILFALINTSILADVSPQHIFLNKWWLFSIFFFLSCVFINAKKNTFSRLQTNTLNLLYFLKTAPLFMSHNLTLFFSKLLFFFLVCRCRKYISLNFAKVGRRAEWAREGERNSPQTSEKKPTWRKWHIAQSKIDYFVL